jgi:hypothetical protein
VSTVPTIASAAESRALQFLVAGGHAVIAHGFPRSTFDLDLIIRRDQKDLWQQLLGELGYVLHHEGSAFIQFNASDSSAFPVDLLLVGESTFEKLWTDAVTGSAWPGVKIISLLNLLALKCHAVKHGHPGRIVKDADDVIRLVQNNSLDIESEELRELFLRHGTRDFYERIRRACVKN